jgi:hypothetical protein
MTGSEVGSATLLRIMGSIVQCKKIVSRKSGYNTCRGWTQIEYQNKHYNIEQNDEGT